MDRYVLKAALQRTAILCNDKFKGVRFELRSNSLRILANNPEQEAAEEETFSLIRPLFIFPPVLLNPEFAMPNPARIFRASVRIEFLTSSKERYAKPVRGFLVWPSVTRALAFSLRPSRGPVKMRVFPAPFLLQQVKQAAFEYHGPFPLA